MNILMILILLALCAALCLIAENCRLPRAANEGENEGEVTPPNFRALVLELLGLAPEASDDDVMAAVTQAKEAAAPTPAEVEAANARFKAGCKALGIAENATPEAFHSALLALPGKLTAAQQAATAANEARDGALVDLAINEGRVPVGKRAEWLGKLKAGFEVAANELATQEIKIPGQKLGDLGQRTVAANTARERIDQIQVAVNELMVDKHVSYDVAYAQVKKDPRFAPLFDAAKKEG